MADAISIPLSEFLNPNNHDHPQALFERLFPDIDFSQPEKISWLKIGIVLKETPESSMTKIIKWSPCEKSQEKGFDHHAMKQFLEGAGAIFEGFKSQLPEFFNDNIAGFSVRGLEIEHNLNVYTYEVLPSPGQRIKEKRAEGKKEQPGENSSPSANLVEKTKRSSP